MYLDPGANLAFGDVFEADWLFDVYVRHDSAAMARKTVKGEVEPLWYVRGSPTRMENERIKVEATFQGDEVVLTQGTLRMGVVLTDDCEIATLAGERAGGWEPRGRILMAGLRPLDGKERGDLELGIHTLPPDPERDFSGGLVDLNRIYAVGTPSLLQTDVAHIPRKVLSLDDDTKNELGERFGGHLLRQGPIAGEIATRKLARMLTAGDDRERLRGIMAEGSEDWGLPEYEATMHDVLTVVDESWFLGRLFNFVDDLADETLNGDDVTREAERRELCRRFAVTLRTLGDAAIRAADALNLPS